MLRVCEDYAHEWGYSELYLNVMTSNKAAFELYTGLGYESVAGEPLEPPSEADGLPSWWPWQGGTMAFLRKRLRPPP